MRPGVVVTGYSSLRRRGRRLTLGKLCSMQNRVERTCDSFRTYVRLQGGVLVLAPAPGAAGQAPAGGRDVGVAEAAAPGQAGPRLDPVLCLGAGPQPDGLAVADHLDRRRHPPGRVELVVLDRPGAQG